MTLQRLTVWVLALTLLFGCIPAHNSQISTQPSIEEATASSEKVNTPGADSSRIHLRTPQTVYIYRYFIDTGIYEKEATTYTGELTLLDVVKFIAKACGVEEPLPILSAYSNGNGGDIIVFKQALLD